MVAMKPKFTVGMARAFGRRPAKEPFPFQEILPLALKNSVSGKGDRQSEVYCLQEMSVMFACMKKNDFNQALCSQEITKFQGCNEYHMKQQQLKQKEGDDAYIGAKARKIPYQKLNKILAQYPQP